LEELVAAALEGEGAEEDERTSKVVIVIFLRNIAFKAMKTNILMDKLKNRTPRDLAELILKHPMTKESVSKVLREVESIRYSDEIRSGLIDNNGKYTLIVNRRNSKAKQLEEIWHKIGHMIYKTTVICRKNPAEKALTEKAGVIDTMINQESKRFISYNPEFAEKIYYKIEN
jgi:hypothetical protein